MTFAPGPRGGALTGASLAAPCATTHSMGINQRVVMLQVRNPMDLKRPTADALR